MEAGLNTSSYARHLILTHPKRAKTTTEKRDRR